ncbi:MAG: hypothetical protein Q7R39_07305 [Dehalococcoidia bacterium]|nr:hypothetical protein [Dehalococcoidia bacterium]
MKNFNVAVLISLCLAMTGLLAGNSTEQSRAASPPARTPERTAGDAVPAIGWETGPTMLCPAGAPIVADGYIFALGGSGSCDPTDIQRSRIQPDGRLDEWVKDEARLPFSLSGFSAFLSGGFVYLHGGYTSSGSVDSVEFAHVENGQWNGWWSFTPNPGYLLVAAKGRLFSFRVISNPPAMGDDRLLAQGALINPDGSPGAWVDLGDFGRHSPSSVVSYGDWIYLLGDSDTGNGGLYRTTVSADGKLGPLQTMNLSSSPVATATVLRNGIYVYSGLAVTRATILPDGSLSAWENLPLAPERRRGANLASAGDSLYVLGGFINGTPTATTLRLRLTPYSLNLPLILNGSTSGGQN